MQSWEAIAWLLLILFAVSVVLLCYVTLKYHRCQQEKDELVLLLVQLSDSLKGTRSSFTLQGEIPGKGPSNSTLNIGKDSYLSS